MIISQFPIYVLCFLLGWVPLYAGYRWLESSIPLKLIDGKTKFSYFPVLFLMYMALEVARAYAIMVIVHDYLVYDLDLIFGVFIWLMAITWPPFIPAKYRTAHWVVLFGIYLYLMPMVAWVWPIGLVALFFLGIGTQHRLLLISILFFGLSLISGFNSLYVLLFLLLCVYAGTVKLPAFQAAIRD